MWGENLNVDGKKVFRTAATKKYDNNYRGAALELYKTISQSPKINVDYLISDDIQTNASKSFWQNWLKNPKKYGIQEIYLYDTEDEIRITDEIIKEKTLDYFWDDEEKQRYRVIVKF